jgi:hypothetical protein
MKKEEKKERRGKKNEKQNTLAHTHTRKGGQQLSRNTSAKYISLDGWMGTCVNGWMDVEGVYTPLARYV